jgi:VWFA-related protein
MFAALPWAAAAFAQTRTPDQPPTFASEVELVTVDAVVLDREGRPVPGLSLQDFVLEEDGRPLEIARFEAIVLEAATTAPTATPGVVATNQDRPGPGRAFALLLDDLALTGAEAIEVRSAVAAFIPKALRAGDEVMLATTSGDVRWTARVPEGREDLLAVLARVHGRYTDPAASMDLMSEYEAYTITNRSTGSRYVTRVVDRWLRANLCPSVGPAGGSPSCPSMVVGRAQHVDALRRGRNRATLDGVRRAIESFGGTRGRKSVLLFSRGFLSDTDLDLRHVGLASRLANAAVYFIDARGLVATSVFESVASAGPPPPGTTIGEMNFEETSLSIAGAQDLADDTGGRTIRNTNDLTTGAERIADESSVYYLLGFHPPEGTSDRSFRKLKVKVTRDDLTVRARRGYTLRTEPKPEKRKDKKRAGPDPLVARALESAQDATAIPLRAMAYVFEPRPKDTTYVVVAVELDASGIAPRSGGDKGARLEVSVTTTRRDDGRGFRHDDVVDVKTEGAAPSGWRSLVREFELPGGVHQARVVVRDPVSGALGSVSQRFEVPPPAGLRISTPILSDRPAPGTSGRGAQPAMAVHRAFASGAHLLCQYEVYGASSPAGQKGAKVSGSMELRAADGSTIYRADATPIAVSADGRIVRTLGLDLAGHVAGTYELLLLVQDDVSGARVERREPFTIAEKAGSH